VAFVRTTLGEYKGWGFKGVYSRGYKGPGIAGIKGCDIFFRGGYIRGISGV